MKRFFAAALMLSMVGMTSVGCSDKATATKKTTVSDQGGTTTKTDSSEVKKTGENPPPAAK